MKNLYIAAFLLLFLAACNNEDDSTSPSPMETISGEGSVNLDFDAFAGEDNLIIGQEYTNNSGEKFTISMFQYYLSNIKLIDDNGNEYLVPTEAENGYYLIKEDRTITLENVPAGDYTKIEFMIGVDSSRNTMEPSERMADLDIGDAETGGQMYWSWNSGYIFMRFEGMAEAVPDSTEGAWVQDDDGNWSFDTNLYTYWGDVFNIHVGGFGGYDTPTPNNTRKVHLHMHDGNFIQVRENQNAPEVHIAVDALKVMDGTKNHSFAEFYQEHSPARTGTVADNMQSMFSIHHIHN